MLSTSPRILIDAVFFQYNRTGIARVWRSLLGEWTRSGFAAHVLVLDRAGTAPQIPGIQYCEIHSHDYGNPGRDRALLQQVCEKEAADLFVSTYYTTPLHTPSLFMAYDMIPEVLRWDLHANAMWRQKQAGILHAQSYIAISHNTAQDLRRFYPSIEEQQVRVSHCGVDFARPTDRQVADFLRHHGIVRPYFLLVGSRGDYKNAALFFEAFAKLGNARERYAVVCTGPAGNLEPPFAALLGPAAHHMLDLSDEALQCAYAGALALAYPSRYEGFGMPLIEAMACGCPVITAHNSSIPEVAGDAALYVDPQDTAAMARALLAVQEPELRRHLVAKGYAQAQGFSWTTMAEQVEAGLRAAAAGSIRPANPLSTVVAPSTLATHNATDLSNDAFYQALHALASRTDLTCFLHLSDSGDTAWAQALEGGLAARPHGHRATLYRLAPGHGCNEPPQTSVVGAVSLHTYRQASVTRSELPLELALIHFYQCTRTALSSEPLDAVLTRLRHTHKAWPAQPEHEGGIEFIKRQQGIAHFDTVVIDGQEFTGEAELLHVLGARVIVLNGVNSYRCFNAYRTLGSHVDYAMTNQNLALRTGFAVFERRF